jgi:simple sugar transport system ATP-binding protein
MVGRDPRELAHATHAPAAAVEEAGRVPFVEVKNLGRKHAVEDMNFSIARGEVLGLAGLLGSGRTETARLLFGVDHHDAGEILVNGKPERIRHPRQAIALGFGFCPEDRKVAGILPDLSVRENIAIALQARRGWWRKISWKKQNELAEQYIKALAIKTPDADKAIRLLSGGNQQKCILARWLASDPQLLIVDEPTRGIDIGAKAEIAALIDKLRERGMSLMVISSEIEELVRLCNRVTVLRDRKKIGDLAGADVSEKGILQRIAG